jgi:hypothetical protein
MSKVKKFKRVNLKKKLLKEEQKKRIICFQRSTQKMKIKRIRTIISNETNNENYNFVLEL